MTTGRGLRASPIHSRIYDVQTIRFTEDTVYRGHPVPAWSTMTVTDEEADAFCREGYAVRVEPVRDRMMRGPGRGHREAVRK